MGGRDIKGPAPNSFGILAKFPSVNANQLELAKNKAQNLKIEALVAEGNLSKKQQLKIDFFDDADKKARLNRAKRTVEEIMNQRAFLLNDRRARLKQLLTSEDKQYEQEIYSTTVTPLERAAELREKAKLIRANKLAEDTKFVQEKLDQKWRLECDELRTYQSKKLQAGMGVEHMRQIEEKIGREKERLEDEGIFAELWYQDIEAKNFREEEKMRKAKERNMQVSQVLKQQMDVLEAQKMEAKRIRNENAKLLKEKSNIEKLEKQLEFQKKRQDQAQRRHELDLCVRAKLINEKKRMQEENAFDLQCLEESIVSFQNEDEERSQRKHELMVEQQHYRRYLEALREEEKRQEMELEQIIQRDTEAQMQKQLAKWKAQKMERKRMLEETLRGRKQQIEERMMKNQQREIEIEREKIHMNKMIEHAKKEEIDDWIKGREKIQRYGEDLVDQMNYNQRQKEIMEENKPLEFNNYLRAEQEYEAKLNHAINDLKFVKGKHY